MAAADVFLHIWLLQEPGVAIVYQKLPRQALMDPGFSATIGCSDLQGHCGPLSLSPSSNPVHPSGFHIQVVFKLEQALSDLVSFHMCGTQPPPALFLCFCPARPT